jgi:hypothetical protein
MALGIRARSDASGSSYGVKRQEARQGSIVSFMRSLFLVCLSLIIFAVLGIGNLPEVKNPKSNENSELPNTSVSATRPTERPSESSTPRMLAASPTSPVATLTSTPTLTPIPTDTPVVIIALVNSPNGLWLREKPGGNQQIELIANESELIVLEGTEMADDLEWIEVRTQSDQEGWVAVPFIVFP